MNEIGDEIATLGEDAGEWVESAAHQAGKRYDKGRNSLSTALERGKDIYEIARRRAVRDTRAANGLLHENLYQTVLIGIGIGVLVGYLVSRRSICNSG